MKSISEKIKWRLDKLMYDYEININDNVLNFILQNVDKFTKFPFISPIYDKKGCLSLEFDNFETGEYLDFELSGVKDNVHIFKYKYTNGIDCDENVTAEKMFDEINNFNSIQSDKCEHNLIKYEYIVGTFRIKISVEYCTKCDYRKQSITQAESYLKIK